MKTPTANTLYTSQTAATRLGCSDARIRQVCIAHDDIGVKHGYAWLLTEDDILKIRELPEFGKRFQPRA